MNMLLCGRASCITTQAHLRGKGMQLSAQALHPAWLCCNVCVGQVCHPVTTANCCPRNQAFVRPRFQGTSESCYSTCSWYDLCSVKDAVRLGRSVHMPALPHAKTLELLGCNRSCREGAPSVQLQKRGHHAKQRLAAGIASSAEICTGTRLEYATQPATVTHLVGSHHTGLNSKTLYQTVSIADSSPRTLISTAHT